MNIKKTAHAKIITVFMVVGFLFAQTVFAAHESTATLTPDRVAGASINDFTLKIVKENGDNITRVEIGTADFTINTDLNTIICPLGWNAENVSANSIMCRLDTGIPIDVTEIVVFQATAPNPPADTSYPWVVTTTDEMGGVWNPSVLPTVVDVTPPGAPTVTTPSAPVIVNADNYFITGTAETDSLVKIYAGINVIGSQQLTGLETAYGISVPLAEDVDNDFTVTATDLAGNESLPATVPTITEDSTAPIINSYTISNPAFSPNGDAIKDTTSIDVSFSETSDYLISIKDSSSTVVESWAGTALNPLPKVWDGAGNTGEGAYIVEIVATDEAGNSITDTSKTITIDNSVPTMDSFAPVNDAYVQTATPLISATLYGTGSDVDPATIIMQIDAVTVSPGYDSGTGVLSFTPVVSLADGTHAVTIDFSDSAGNPAIQANWSFTVDATPPVITLLGDATINLTVGDSYSEPGATALDNIDGSIVVGISGAVNTAVSDTYIITYTATDTASNTATTTRTVNVNSPPASIIVPSGGGGGGGGFIPPTIPPPVIPPIIPQVLGATIFNFTSDLGIGMESDAVAELQKRLTAENVYSGPITGYFGPLTLAGVRSYQAKYGINQTGFVGPITRANLNGSQVAGASISANAETIKAQIAVLQAQLVMLLQQLAQTLQAEASNR